MYVTLDQIGSDPIKYGTATLRRGPRLRSFPDALLLHVGVDDGLATSELLHVQLRLLLRVGAAEPLPPLLGLLENLRRLIDG